MLSDRLVAVEFGRTGRDRPNVDRLCCGGGTRDEVCCPCEGLEKKVQWQPLQKLEDERTAAGSVSFEAPELSNCKPLLCGGIFSNRCSLQRRHHKHEVQSSKFKLGLFWANLHSAPSATTLPLHGLSSTCNFSL